MTTLTSKQSARVTLPADDQILITREFAAPAHLVYEAFTKPELVARWWHAKRGNVQSIEADLRVGGSYRYVMTTFDGFEVAFHGEYREIVPNRRIVATEVYEGAPDSEGLNTATFEESGGRTLLSILARYPSQAVRDMVIQSGMEAGMQDGLDLMEEVAVSAA